MNPEKKAAPERLLAIAAGDTRQSRRVADFLLAWWNASDCGGFDFTATIMRAFLFPIAPDTDIAT